MKTIEEAAVEDGIIAMKGYDRYDIQQEIGKNCHDSFICGVEFAQRWIPIEEQELPIKMAILCNRENSILPNVYYFDTSTRAAFVTAKYKIISWRPIELK